MKIRALMFLVTLVLAPLAVYAQEPQVPEQKDEISGIYEVSGLNPDGGSYQGLVLVTRTGQTYKLRVEIGDDFTFGIGLLKGSSFAVSFFGQGTISVALYQVESDSRLVGEWTDIGADGQTYPESWVKRESLDLFEKEPASLKPPASPQQIQQPPGVSIKKVKTQ